MTEDHREPAIEQGDVEALAVTHGQQLATARAAAKLTTLEVAQKLCITGATIALIESGRWAEAGPDVYVRGYVVGYGRLLEVDSSEAVSYFRQRQADRIASDSLVAQNVQRRPGLIQYQRFAGYAVATLLIGPALIFWVAQGFRGADTGIDAGTTEVAGSVVPAAIIDQIPPQKTIPGTAVDERPVMASMAAIPDSLPASRSVEMALSPIMQTADDLEPLVEPPANMLELDFQEDVWLEISDLSGARLGYGLMSASSDRSFSIDQGLKVRLGNANSVVARVDGEFFDLTPFITQDVADFVLPKITEIDSESEPAPD